MLRLPLLHLLLLLMLLLLLLLHLLLLPPPLLLLLLLRLLRPLQSTGMVPRKSFLTRSVTIEMSHDFAFWCTCLKSCKMSRNALYLAPKCLKKTAPIMSPGTPGSKATKLDEQRLWQEAVTKRNATVRATVHSSRQDHTLRICWERVGIAPNAGSVGGMGS